MTRRFSADAAIVSGSGLAVVPAGAVVDDEVGYGELGWPATAVAGHPNRLVACRLGSVRLLLAFGRPHLYEGWDDDELRRPVADLARWGVRRLVCTNAAGGLGETATGDIVVAHEVIDLQSRPRERPAPLAVCSPAAAAAVVTALDENGRARPGRYAAVPGPQYETPAEARWLATFADAVGMSTAPEIRTALGHGLEACVLSVVVNPSGAAGDHAAVLAAAAGGAAGRSGRGAASLARRLPRVLAARWPELAEAIGAAG